MGFRDRVLCTRSIVVTDLDLYSTNILCYIPVRCIDEMIILLSNSIVVVYLARTQEGRKDISRI